jgi:hypothetical protein
MLMIMDEQVRWRGVGRWLSFTIGGVFLLAAIPHFAADDPAAGWNIFLGLLLFGAMAAGSRRAPSVLLVLAVVMVVRIVLAFMRGHLALIDGLGNVLVLVALLVAWFDLRKQSTRMSRLKLSAVVRRFLDGTGGERELENYVHGNLTSNEEEKFLNPLMAIGAKYTVGLVPGVYNEKARPELEALASKLERDGL